MGLTAKQAAFAFEYTLDHNASAAAIRAGYSPLSAGAIGHENLTKPEVVAEIERLSSQARVANAITPDFIISKLMDTYRDAAAVDEFSTVVKCLELIGRHIGMWPKHVGLQRSIGTRAGTADLDLSRLTDEELRTLQALHDKAANTVRIDAAGVPTGLPDVRANDKA